MRFPPQRDLKWSYLYVDCVILHWYACDADGRSYGHVTSKFLDVQVTKFSYPWCSAAGARAPLLRSRLTNKPLSPGKVCHATGVYVLYSFRTVVWVL